MRQVELTAYQQALGIAIICVIAGAAQFGAVMLTSWEFPIPPIFVYVLVGIALASAVHTVLFDESARKRTVKYP